MSGNQVFAQPKPDRGKAAPVIITVRPEVARFAQLMEKKLAANDHKQHWSTCSKAHLLRRLREECEELWNAAFWGQPRDVRLEAADVGNFAMMIADVWGQLTVAENDDEAGEADGC